MLKGLTTIELTDVNTGQVDTYSYENMVTNALTEVFRPLGLAKSPALFYSSFAPFHEVLLGGILLFDSRIDENPNNFFAPSNANLVACGVMGIQNSTTGTLRGGYNVSESEFDVENGFMKYVYDFTTTQGNGTINSVCLTHINSGYDGYGSKDVVTNTTCQLVQVCNGDLQYVRTTDTGANTSDKYGGYTVGVSEQIFLIDRGEDVVYYFRIDGTDQLTFTKRKAYLKNVSVFENPNTTKALVYEETITLDEPLVSTTNVTYNFDTSDNCLYLVGARATSTAIDGTFQVIKIELDTWEVTNYTATNTTGVIIGTNRSIRFGFVCDGYLLVKANASPYTIYKLEIDNWANVTEFSRPDGTILSSTPAFALNNRVYYRSTSSGQVGIANMETCEVLRPSCNGDYGSYNGAFTPVLNEPLLFFYSQGVSQGWSYAGSFVMQTNYLATINNLGETVTKTADKTMKITYLIREEL